MRGILLRGVVWTSWLVASSAIAQAAPQADAAVPPSQPAPVAEPKESTPPAQPAAPAVQSGPPAEGSVAPSTSTAEAAPPTPLTPAPSAPAPSAADTAPPDAAASRGPTEAPAAQPLAPVAQPAQAPMRVPPAEPASTAEEQDRSAKKLYMRFGAGFGFPFGPDVADKYEDRGSNALHFSGYSFALDVMAGTAVLPGLVIGGGAASDTVAGGTVRNGNQDKRGLEHSLYYAVIGGFADFYTAPPAGLHFQALLGLARLSPATDLGHNTALGFGTVLGVGYDLPVGRRWNLGALARLAFSPLGMGRVAGQQPSPTFYEPSLLWTATFRPGEW